MAAPSQDGAHRHRFTVPAADVSTLEWIAQQENLSYSLRALVRDYIERHGYTDPHNRPVRQLPRRGRPPQDGGGRESGYEDDEVQEEPQQERPRSQRPQAVQPQQERAPRPEPRQPEPQQRRSEPAAPRPQAPVATDGPGSTPGAEGVGAFFSANRD